MATTNEIKDEIERCANVASSKFMDKDFPNLTETQQACITGVNFLWGHPIEVVTTLQEYTQHDEKKFEKFPLIALFTDIVVSIGKYGDYDGCLLSIVIAHFTEPTYTAPQREVNVFAPVLRPIYNYFIDELSKSSVFSVQDPKQDLKHEKIERFYWGREGIYGNTGTIFNDYIDAIEIRNLDLKINLQNCY